jgi:hypothetical protein
VRKLTAGALLLVGSVGGARLLRGRAARRLRLDVYYEDGAMLSLAGATPEAEPVLARAREALRAAART